MRFRSIDDDHRARRRRRRPGSITLPRPRMEMQIDGRSSGARGNRDRSVHDRLATGIFPRT